MVSGWDFGFQSGAGSVTIINIMTFLCSYWKGDATAFDQEWKQRTRQTSNNHLRDRQRTTLRALEGTVCGLHPTLSIKGHYEIGELPA